MALVDAEYSFIWTAVGTRENTHDSTLLHSTDLQKNVFVGEKIPNGVQQV